MNDVRKTNAYTEMTTLVQQRFQAAAEIKSTTAIPIQLCSLWAVTRNNDKKKFALVNWMKRTKLKTQNGQWQKQQQQSNKKISDIHLVCVFVITFNPEQNRIIVQIRPKNYCVLHKLENKHLITNIARIELDWNWIERDRRLRVFFFRKCTIAIPFAQTDPYLFLFWYCLGCCDIHVFAMSIGWLWCVTEIQLPNSIWIFRHKLLLDDRLSHSAYRLTINIYASRYYD